MNKQPEPSSGCGKRQLVINAVRNGVDIRDKDTDYDSLFILPIHRISNRQIEHRCYSKYKGGYKYGINKR